MHSYSLLCVQHQPDDRSNITSVVGLLNRESVLPHQTEPIFLIEKVLVEKDFRQKIYYSTNQVTLSKLQTR